MLITEMWGFWAWYFSGWIGAFIMLYDRNDPWNWFGLAFFYGVFGPVLILLGVYLKANRTDDA